MTHLPQKRGKQRVICMETLKQMHEQGHPPEKIAADMGFAVGTIKQRIARLFPKVQETVEISRDEILPLWIAGATMPELAEAFGCNEKTLRLKVRQLHLPRRAWVNRRWHIIEEKRDPDAPAEEPATMTGRLLATKGKWSALAKVAAKHGLTMTQVQQQYHRARAG